MQDKILVVWSNYYRDLADKHLKSCKEVLDNANLAYDVEKVEAGTYELPLVISQFNHHKPYAGYLPLGLLLKGNTDHYEFIWEHVKECFIKFALDGIAIGNGIICAPSMELINERVDNNSRVQEAVNALAYLTSLNHKFK